MSSNFQGKPKICCWNFSLKFQIDLEAISVAVL